ncbi:MAG: hypothetical protein HPM95_22315, partial [Alphaproteobacteria bacterium]|nr:hypothetical protein [Alphaproteobacteria bacterium]
PSKGWRYAAAGLLFVPIAGVAAANFVAGPVVGVWPSPPGDVIAALALVPGLAALRAMARGAALSALPRALLAGFLLIVATWGFTLPGLSPIWISPRLADAVAMEASCPAPRVANVGFNEPSYIFLQGTDTLPTSAEGAARFAGPRRRRGRLGALPYCRRRYPAGGGLPGGLGGAGPVARKKHGAGHGAEHQRWRRDGHRSLQRRGDGA